MSNATQSLIEYLYDKERSITDTIRMKAEACKQDYLAV